MVTEARLFPAQFTHRDGSQDFSQRPRDRQPGLGLDPRAAIAAALADPGMMLVELGVVRVEMMPVEEMPVADAAIPSQV